MQATIAEEGVAPALTLHGVLLLDKPLGMTSNGALQAVRRLFFRAKAGHTGTLDPLATGLLPICLGEATKFSGGLLDSDKSYEAIVRLGSTTTTDDAEGEIVEQRAVDGCAARAADVVAEFLGEIEQIPPMFSALKHRGQPLYDYARRGEEVVRAPRRIRIHALQLEPISAVELRMTVSCSKGTYVRTLARDIGKTLGCGAHLAALRRTRTGPFSLRDAVTIDALSDEPVAARVERLLPLDELLIALPKIELEAVDAQAVLNGRIVGAPQPSLQGLVRLYDAAARFLGVGLAADGRIGPHRMCSRPLTGAASRSHVIA